MKTYYWILLFFFVSCSLNSEQERSLHLAVTEYVASHNTGAVMSYVSLTHPNVVAYYKDLGDSVFQAKFELVSEDSEGYFLQDATVRSIKKDNGKVHVLYRFLRVDQDYLTPTADECEIVAISDDDGKKWFFMEMEDYKNDAIYEKKNRLIDTK